MTTTILTAGMPRVLSAADVALDQVSRELIGPRGAHRLSRGPFAVLQELMVRPERIVSVGRLVEVLWSNDRDEPLDAEAAVRKRVLAARDALEAVGASRDQLELRFQAGYRMNGKPSRWRKVTAEQEATLDAMAVRTAA